jgi:hypothetical protein
VTRGVEVVRVPVAPCLVPLEHDSAIVAATDKVNADRNESGRSSANLMRRHLLPPSYFGSKSVCSAPLEIARSAAEYRSMADMALPLWASRSAVWVDGCRGLWRFQLGRS